MTSQRVIERKVIKGNEDGLNDIFDSLAEANAYIRELKEKIKKEKTHGNQSVSFSRALGFKIYKKNKYSYLIDYTVIEKYFTEDTLQSAVGEQGMQQISAVSIDPGKAFLSGETTNIQHKDPEVDDTKKTENTSSTSNKEEKEENLDKKAKNTLTQGLGNFTTDQLGSITVDGGASLLSSQISQASYNITQLDQVKGITNMAAGSLGAYGMGKELVNSAPEIVTTLATTIISKVTEVVTEEVTKLGTEYLANHAKYALAFPTKITSYAMAYFNANKMSIGDILKSLNETSEDRAEKEDEQSNEKQKSNFMSKINSNSKKFIDKMNGFVKTGTSYIGMITSYIQNGPEWVIDQVDKQIGELVDGARKEIDKQWEKDKAAYDAKAKLLGDKLGAEMTEKYNNQIKAAQKKQKEKLDKQKKKALNQVTALKAKAASLLGSMLGNYIPIG